MALLLFNADDFGRTVGVTKGIIACELARLPISTSAMPCVDGAEAVLKTYSQQFNGGIGAHLQLTFGKPVLPPGEIPTLVDADGRFPTRRISPYVDSIEVALEWRAQVERLRSWGIEPDHIDTHHHVHGRPENVPKILAVFSDLANELGLPARSGDASVAAYLRNAGVRCPDLSISLSELDCNLNSLIAELEAAKASGPSDLIVEIVCHPGYWSKELELLTLPKYAATREKELTLLCDPKTQQRLKAAGWSAVRYRELSGRNVRAV
jgi:predicted glycoside hydrolase/deacetylase ChbG (UPF0249 family)